MSFGKASPMLLLALIVAVAMCLANISDDSSAEWNLHEDPPLEDRGAPSGMMPERKGVVVIDPGHMHEDPFSLVMDFEKVSAEKKHLESHGKEVFIIHKPGMGHPPALDAIFTILGQERFLTQDQTVLTDIEEVVEMDKMSENRQDDQFLDQVSEVLSEIDPETAQAVKDVLSVRERIRSYETYQKAIAVGYYSVADRREDAEDEKDIGEEVIFEEEETEDREPVVFEVPIIVISDGCGVTGYNIGDSPAAHMHGAADGPGL